MRKNIGTALFLALALITAFSSCSIDVDEYTTDPRYILGLGGGSSRQDLLYLIISTAPSKTEYVLGESADWSGLTVMEYYSDNTIGTGYSSDYEISGFDAWSLGPQIITVKSRNGIQTSFTIYVTDSRWNPTGVLDSLSISSYPSKTMYNLYETADWSGLEVMESYSDGSTRIGYSYEYTISGFDSFSSGEKTITVSKNSTTGSYVYTSFTVTVNSAAVLSSLSIASMPSKTVYTVGESSDWSGLMVTEYYSDGSTSTGYNYDYTITGFDPWIIGQQTITVSKYGTTGGYVDTTFTVTVNSAGTNVVLTSLSISSYPKTVYMVGESADWTGLSVTESYSDGTTRTGYSSEYDISYFDPYFIGQQTITVSKNNNGYAETSFIAIVTNVVSAFITDITYDYAWTLEGDEWQRSPGIGHSDITKARVYFYSTSTSANITIRLNVSSEPGYDFAFISTLDNSYADSYNGYYTRISGTTSETVSIPVSTPGQHFIEIGYQKDGGVVNNSDCAWFKILQ